MFFFSALTKLTKTRSILTFSV